MAGAWRSVSSFFLDIGSGFRAEHIVVCSWAGL